LKQIDFPAGMSIRISLVFSFFLFLTGMTVAADAQKAPDYGRESNWLCKPGRVDACAVDVNAMAISAKGEQTVEPFVHTPVEEKKVDCFYVYPTVFMQDADLSNLGRRAPSLAAYARNLRATPMSVVYSRRCTGRSR
jgi:hypothetical protein